MTGGAAAGLVAGWGVALPVGPVGSYLVGLAAREPQRTATAAALGVATTDGCYALAAVIGGAGLAAALRPVAAALTGSPASGWWEGASWMAFRSGGHHVRVGCHQRVR